jgi:uncharacterized membrane protein YhiD involved in acid resistance
MKRVNKVGILVAAFVVVAAAGVIAGMLLFGGDTPGSTEMGSVAERSTASNGDAAVQSTPAPASNQGGNSLISQIFGGEQPAADPQTTGWLTQIGRVVFRLLVAAVLGAILAFRRHRTPGQRRNPFVAETQTLLALVASALMMIVADNAARAFGIFAAASLVRFRTNIRDPKEITVLLINLAIGLAAGVGRWELAVILCVFVFLTLWLLERYESSQLVRSLELKVRTHNVAEADEALQKIFRDHRLAAEVRQLDREDDKDPIGTIVYRLTVDPRISTDQLSDEIFAAVRDNIDTIEWHQKKNHSYAYR